MVDEKEILKKLLVDETYAIKDLAILVDKAKDIFVIEKSSGKVIFKDFGGLTDPQRICALLVGRYFAVKVGILKESSLSISEISKTLGRPLKPLSGRMTELIKKGYVEKLTNRKYMITYHRIHDIFKVYFGAKKHG